MGSSATTTRSRTPAATSPTAAKRRSRGYGSPFPRLGVSQEKDGMYLLMCRLHVMEAGLLMPLSFRVRDDACWSSPHAPLCPTPPPALVLTPPLRRLLCASIGHRLLSHCGRLSSSYSRRSSWGEGERTSKATTSRYTMGFSPAYASTPPSRQRYCWSSRTCSRPLSPPARYTLDVNVVSAEDVVTHQQLLEVEKGEV